MKTGKSKAQTDEGSGLGEDSFKLRRTEELLKRFEHENGRPARTLEELEEWLAKKIK